MDNNLTETTRELLINRPRTMTFYYIYEQTDIKKSWLAQFATGNIKEPSANTIQKLYEFLSGKKLEL